MAEVKIQGNLREKVGSLQYSWGHTHSFNQGWIKNIWKRIPPILNLYKLFCPLPLYPKQLFSQNSHCLRFYKSSINDSNHLRGIH